jgi:nitronate monooxygenase
VKELTGLMKLTELLEIELPIIQAPMAGSQGSALAIAVSNAGGLGSQPCAMIGPDQIRKELQAITAATSKPYNVNFFVHKQPTPDPAREKAWRKVLAPYFAEYGIDPDSIQAGPQRLPFDDAAADVLEDFKPPVVSFHFGLPSDALMKRVRAGARRSCRRRRRLTSAVSQLMVWTRSSRKGPRPAAIGGCF